MLFDATKSTKSGTDTARPVPAKRKSEVYSLKSDQFKTIERNLHSSFQEFYSNKRMIILPDNCPPADKLEKFVEFKKNWKINMRRVLHEYKMGVVNPSGKFAISVELSPEIQEYIIYISKFQCQQSSGLKPEYTIQGKNAEAATILVINNLLHYFKINNRAGLKTKSYSYGGDGGYDFALGKYRFDVKYRDDGPHNGLILRERFFKKVDDDIILIFVTNATNFKVGTKLSQDVFYKPFNEIHSVLSEKVLPFAIAGWISMGDFKKKKAPYSGEKGAWVVDNLNPVKDLINMIIKDQIESEEWFV